MFRSVTKLNQFYRKARRFLRLQLASCSCADQVMVTDGNEQSVSNLLHIIQENYFGNTSVNTRLLRWGPESVDHDLAGAFDWVLCADCLFFDEGREHLVDTIFSLLKPGGQALIFAPNRNGTFGVFCKLAESKFTTEICSEYDDHVWKLHTQLKENSETYSEDLHLPVLAKLTKLRSHSPESRDVTPESR